MNNEQKVVFAGKLAPKEKPKSVFSCLVDKSLGTGSDQDFNAKIKAYREARATRNGGK